VWGNNEKTFNFLYAESDQEEVQAKIEHALICNARYSNISDVQLTALEESTQYPGSYYVVGVYKSVSSVGVNKFGLSLGDEFHPSSGSFKCIIDKNLKLKKIEWKVGIMKGYVRNGCLGTRQEAF